MDSTSVIEHACSIARFIVTASECLSALRQSLSAGTSPHTNHDRKGVLDKLHSQTQDLQNWPGDSADILSKVDEAILRVASHSQKFTSQLSKCFEASDTCEGKTSLSELISKLDVQENPAEILQLIKTDLNEVIANDQWAAISQWIKELGARNTRLDVSRYDEIGQLAAQAQSCFSDISLKDVGDAQKLELWLQVRKMLEEALNLSTEQIILTTLNFWTLERRKNLIPKQHEDTFSWILSDSTTNDASQPVSNFAAWSKTDEPFYWISGKPGSGKSTLVKFVSQSPEAMRGLRHWAQNDTLVTADFYFWSSATDPLQKSGAGLLRSILFQILRRCPDLIQHAYPDQWQTRHTRIGAAQKSAATEPTIEELLATYYRIVARLPSVGTKFCFFIDGLDEYDGRPADLIRLIQSLMKTKNLKICASSRQWAEFEAIYGGTSPWKLYMHELTRQDMELYAKSLLNYNRRFTTMKEAEPEDKYESLLTGLVEKAEGVFLWVFLIVRDLLRGIDTAKDLGELLEKVLATKSDLDGYFNDMFLHVQPHMREEMAHVFEVALNASDKVPLASYWLIRERAFENANEAIRDIPAALSTKTGFAKVMGWLEEYSQGLLTAEDLSSKEDTSETLNCQQWLFGYRVDFLHRTVSDFLQTVEMREFLQKWSMSSFNVHLEICKASLLTIQMTPPTTDMFNDVSRALSALHLFMSHARLAEGQQATKLLDSMRATLVEHNKTLTDLPMMILGAGNYWAYDASLEFVFLFHCVSYDLGEYVATLLDKGGLAFQESPSGLLSGCFSRDYRIRTGKLVFSTDSIDVLLQQGLDPNLSWGDRAFSFWQQLVTAIYSRYLKSDLMPSDFEAVKSAIAYGADDQATVEVFAARNVGGMKASEIVEKVAPQLLATPKVK